MAEGGNHEKSEDQNCSICLETFNVPRTLPCQHTFCHKCLSDFIATSGQNLGKNPSFSCPVCRTIVYCTSAEGKDQKEWPSLFPQNVNILALSGKSKADVNYACDSCFSSACLKNSSGYCLDCKEHVCDGCTELHGKINILKSHKIIARDELIRNPSVAIAIDFEQRCSIHKKEIGYFCKDHDAVCCRKCFLMKHRACKDMVDLQTDVPEALEEISNDVTESMKRIEKHLANYAEKTESYLMSLEKQTTNLSIVLKEAKESIIKLFDIMETEVDQMGKHIFNEESSKRSKEVRQCQSLLTAIRNSYQLLDGVIRLGSKTQVFLTTRQTQEHLAKYREQVVQKYCKLESKEVSITLHDSLKTLLSLQDTKLATVDSLSKSEELSLSEVIITPRSEVSVREAVCPNATDPDYEGATCLHGNNFILVDRRNDMCCLYDAEFQHISDHKLTSSPRDICVVDADEVAVSQPNSRKIQFLTATAPITPTRSITTRHYCRGLVALSKNKLVISGYDDRGNQNYYWSIVATSGKEEYYHEIDQKGDEYTYLAVNKSKTRLYMSCYTNQTVYCFGLDGQLYFAYQNDRLIGPRGIGLDREDNVYVVGSASGDLHQLSPDGALLQIVKSGIPTSPQKIAFYRNGSTFLVTSYDEGRKCYLFRLK